MKLKTALVLILFTACAKAQMPLLPSKHNLEKKVNIEVKDQPVSEVLKKISRAGAFYFSYNGTLIKQDSLVTLTMRNTPVRVLLDKIFSNKVDYTENGEYIMLRYAANRFNIEPENITTAEKLYLISGYIVDTHTGLKVKQASVYEKRLLQSTLTDGNGHFKLKFKGDHNEVILTASKESYRDTTLIFLSDIKIKPEAYKNQDDRTVNVGYGDIANSGIGKFFLSSKQRIQSLNIPYFFAHTPFQASFTPGLSSHGSMSSQVVNKVSLNILGGYTAGTDGLEVAGLFNITKGDIKKMQVAGLFNQAGGSVDGIQVAGLLNDVRDDVRGFQVAGLVNHIKKEARGFQVAGICNVTGKSMKGMQTAGVLNINADNFNGFQVGGVGNVASNDMNGVQIAGVFNFAKKVKGLQIGLINVADTSSGWSLGLLNFIKNGYHKISVFTNETVNTNISLKTGNAKLYTILFIGMNTSPEEKIKTAGIGLGHDFILKKRLSLGMEITGQMLYLGNWDNANTLSRIQANLQYELFKGFTIFGGPAYSVYGDYNPADPISPGYKQQVVPSYHNSFSNTTKGWVGFNAGIILM